MEAEKEIQVIESVKKWKIAIFIGAVVLAAIIGFVVGMNVGLNKNSNENSNEKPETVNLTKENFNEYFTYEVTGQPHGGVCQRAEIIITFHPRKFRKFELEYAEFTITIDEKEDYENFSIRDMEFNDAVTRNVKIPYDGEFSVKFSDDPDAASDERCWISWYKYNVYIEEVIDIIIESASGTIKFE